MSRHAWPLSGIRVGGHEEPLPAIGSTLAALSDLSQAERDLVREGWVAAAFLRLPDLPPEETRLAQDKLLSREAAWWRIQFREIQKERDHFAGQVDRLQHCVGDLTRRINAIAAGFDEPKEPAESPAVLSATG